VSDFIVWTLSTQQYAEVAQHGDVHATQLQVVRLFGKQTSGDRHPQRRTLLPMATFAGRSSRGIEKEGSEVHNCPWHPSATV